MNTKNILILYDHRFTYIGVVRHYLESFKKYSKHNIFYAAAVGDMLCIGDLARFDIVMVHYSVRMCYGEIGGLLSKSFLEALINFQGEKILFIQDEYDKVNFTKDSIKKIGFNTVFTCVPKESIELVYPKSEFPKVNFITVLTGYVAEELETDRHVLPISERKTFIAYRGRILPFFYGNLGREKYEIAVRIKELAKQHNIFPVDLECDDERRIYGAAWFEFLKDAKATLITESGSNIFDFTGELREKVDGALSQNPQMTYEEIHREFLCEHEDKIKMNQISPKVFESITLKTALIGFEGEYSGIIKPYEHYIPLKKDYSNIEEVFSYLRDDIFLQGMVDRAYNDIILPKKYSFKTFVEYVDGFLKESRPASNTVETFYIMPNDVFSLKDDENIILAGLPSNQVLDQYQDPKWFNALLTPKNEKLTQDNKILVQENAVLIHENLVLTQKNQMLMQEKEVWLQENASLLQDNERYRKKIFSFQALLNTSFLQFFIKGLKHCLPGAHELLGKLYYKMIK